MCATLGSFAHGTCGQKCSFTCTVRTVLGSRFNVSNTANMTLQHSDMMSLACHVEDNLGNQANVITSSVG